MAMELRSEIKTFAKNTPRELTVDTTAFPAMRGFKTWMRLLKLLGPSLGSVGEAFEGASGIKLEGDFKTALASLQIDAGAVVRALGNAMADLDVDSLYALAHELLADTAALVPSVRQAGQLERKELKSTVNIDYVFSGRLRLLFEVLGWVAWVNFEDFFPGDVTQLAQVLAGKTAAPEQTVAAPPAP